MNILRKLIRRISPVLLVILALSTAAAAQSTQKIEIGSAWDRLFGVVYKGASQGLANGQQFEVWRAGAKIGVFTLTQVSNTSAKGNFVPDDTVSQLLKGDQLKLPGGADWSPAAAAKAPRRNEANPALSSSESGPSQKFGYKVTSRDSGETNVKPVSKTEKPAPPPSTTPAEKPVSPEKNVVSYSSDGTPEIPGKKTKQSTAAKNDGSKTDSEPTLAMKKKQERASERKLESEKKKEKKSENKTDKKLTSPTAAAEKPKKETPAASEPKSRFGYKVAPETKTPKPEPEKKKEQKTEAAEEKKPTPPPVVAETPTKEATEAEKPKKETPAASEPKSRFGYKVAPETKTPKPEPEKKKEQKTEAAEEKKPTPPPVVAETPKKEAAAAEKPKKETPAASESKPRFGHKVLTEKEKPKIEEKPKETSVKKEEAGPRPVAVEKKAEREKERSKEKADTPKKEEKKQNAGQSEKPDKQRYGLKSVPRTSGIAPGVATVPPVEKGKKTETQNESGKTSPAGAKETAPKSELITALPSPQQNQQQTAPSASEVHPTPVPQPSPEAKPAGTAAVSFAPETEKENQQFPENMDAERHVIIADEYLFDRSYHKALEHYAAAFAIDPRNERAKNGLVETSKRLGIMKPGDETASGASAPPKTLDEASLKDDLNQIHLQGSNDVADIQNNYAVYLIQEKKYLEALDWLNDAIKANPKTAVYYRNRAVANFGLGRNPEAVYDAKKAMDLGDEKAGKMLEALRDLIKKQQIERSESNKTN